MVEAHGYDEEVAQDHPFKIKFKYDNGSWKFYVVPGTVNSKMPTLKNLGRLDTNPRPMSAVSVNAEDVYLVCPFVENEAFPKDPKVETDTTTPADTDEFAHITIGSIQLVDGRPVRLSQVVETSLWIERLKCGDDDAEYYVARS